MAHPRRRATDNPPATLAERVQAATGDADLAAEVAASERVTAAKALYAVANGKTEELWKKIRRGLAIVAGIVGTIFVAGGEWSNIRRVYTTTIPEMQTQQAAQLERFNKHDEKVDALVHTVDKLTNELAETIQELEKIQRADEWYRRTLPRSGGS